MKKIMPIILLSISCHIVNAQIFATTSAGKKVILYTDGTWQYHDGTSTEGEKECVTAHTGTVTFKNITNSDVYVYLTTFTSIRVKDIITMKVKPGLTKSFNDVATGVTSWSNNLTEYHWKASLEMAEPDVPFTNIQPLAAGTVKVSDCANKEIEIDN